VTQVAQAKNAAPFDGRPACDGHGACVPLCPIKAKYEALFHVEKAIKEGAELHANAVVTKLTFDTSSGNVTEVTYKDWQRKEDKKVRARVVVLAGNAIESPRLLLHSEKQQSGTPNRWIGKFLMDHPGTSSYGLVPEPVYPFRGPSTTSNITTTSDGPFREFYAGFRTSLLNYGWTTNAPRGATFDPVPLTEGPEEDPAGTVLDFVHKSKLIGHKLQEKIRHHAHRQIVLGTALEQLPDEGNSVALADKPDIFDVPLPKLTYSYDDSSGYVREGLKAARLMHKHIFTKLGATTYRLFEFDPQGALTKPTFFGAGHIMGTMRMGKQGEARVVDADCRSVDHHNLFIVGSGVFVTGAVANPTLTIAALSLRAADAIIKEFREHS
jgi:choline dehydrogenase-like flavoprotein